MTHAPILRVVRTLPPPGGFPRSAGLGLARAWLIAAATSLLASLPAFAQGDVAGPVTATGAPDTWYALTLTEGETQFKLTHLWSWGRKFRSETVVSGHPIVTIVNGSTYYTIDLVTAQGVAIERAPEALTADAKGGRPFANDLEVLIATGGEKFGPDPEGRLCDLYRRTNDAGRVSMCMSRSPESVPVYIEIYDRASTQIETARYLEWQRGFAIDPSFFEPPPNVNLERIDYASYRKRSGRETIGPAPPLFADLLHGIPSEQGNTGRGVPR